MAVDDYRCVQSLFQPVDRLQRRRQLCTDQQPSVNFGHFRYSLSFVDAFSHCPHSSATSFLPSTRVACAGRSAKLSTQLASRRHLCHDNARLPARQLHVRFYTVNDDSTTFFCPAHLVKVTILYMARVSSWGQSRISIGCLAKNET